MAQWSKVISKEVECMPSPTIERFTAENVKVEVKARSVSLASIRFLLANGRLPVTSIPWLIKTYGEKLRPRDYQAYVNALGAQDSVKAMLELGENGISLSRLDGIARQQSGRISAVNHKAQVVSQASTVMVRKSNGSVVKAQVKAQEVKPMTEGERILADYNKRQAEKAHRDMVGIKGTTKSANQIDPELLARLNAQANMKKVCVIK